MEGFPFFAVFIVPQIFFWGAVALIILAVKAAIRLWRALK